jgi:RNA polymerase sigma-70 factor (ECF subfamily)
MQANHDFAELLERSKAGDPAAIRDFLARYERDVLMVARARLPRKLRTQFDSIDFVQAVWKSFFSDLGQNPREFANSTHLGAYLAGVVRNKVREQHRRLTRTGKYDVSREEPLHVRRGDREVLREVVTPDPSPSDLAQACDRLEQLTAGLSPREIKVLTLRIEGLTLEEIAARTGMNERSVRRVIDAVRSRMGSSAPF